jgi:hypothetical protein
MFEREDAASLKVVSSIKGWSAGKIETCKQSMMGIEAGERG